jgi:hypothetical protein
MKRTVSDYNSCGMTLNLLKKIRPCLFKSWFLFPVSAKLLPGQQMSGFDSPVTLSVFQLTALH